MQHYDLKQFTWTRFISKLGGAITDFLIFVKKLVTVEKCRLLAASKCAPNGNGRDLFGTFEVHVYKAVAYDTSRHYLNRLIVHPV